uniref:SERPIN domain-containing protein n=1 Tax=Globodera pallida TaxID=36090 RepID=A0A183C5F5_GLOPA
MDASNALILEAQTDFALNLLREVSKDGRSCIVSPFSEKTSQEMVQLLAKGAPESKVHEYFGELVKAIQKGSSNYTLEVANKVYVKEGFSTFKTMINRHYGGQFEAINFEKAVDSAKKINKFVEKATHDKIHDLIKPDMFDVNTRLVLINAVYFKGNWAEKFDAHRTQKKTFHIDANNKKELDMMHKKDEFIYFEDDQLQLLGMPYKGGEVFMFVLLPKERFGLDKMLAKLDGKSLLELLKKRSKQEVEVELPKFKLESAHDLNEPLEKLGMPTAFTDSANFAGILPGHQLKISKVVQKAFIEVNEEGTEAAAATAIVFQFKSMPILMPKPVFRADHPFAIFLLTNNYGPLFGVTFRA